MREASYTSVSVSVSATTVSVTQLDAGIVTAVEWTQSNPGVEGPYRALPSHQLSSEGSEGWLYVSAAYSDGTTYPVETGVTAYISAPSNQSIDVSYVEGHPPRLSVLSGASSLADAVEVHTCLGVAYALVNVTLPAPTSITITSYVDVS